MKQKNYGNKGRLYTGLLLVAAGALLFLSKMGAPVPGWVFSWPVALILFGVLMGIKHKFRNAGGWILILIGGVNLIDQLVPGMSFHSYVLPIIIIAIGLIFILRPAKSYPAGDRSHGESFGGVSNTSAVYGATERTHHSDYIDSTSVFGGVKKVIVSKDFRGGDVTCFMGGAEFNLSQADIKGTVVLDVTQIFGGTKLIVPPHWHVKTDVVTIFGGIEDKRPVAMSNDGGDKVLLVKGTSIFGGIDIRSY